MIANHAEEAKDASSAVVIRPIAFSAGLSKAIVCFAKEPAGS